jgi:small GTP-binding protein
MSTKVYHFKLVMVGDTGVGKSCLASRFVRDEFFEFQEPTIGAAFMTQTVLLDDCTVKFEIWDTAGQERYRSLAPMYYRGAAVAIAVYDITNKDSFRGAQTWVRELQNRGGSDMIIVLVGNKSDLPESQRKVTGEKAQKYSEEVGIIHIETSAKNSNNVNQLFIDIAKKIPKTAKESTSENIFTISHPKKIKNWC